MVLVAQYRVKVPSSRSRENAGWPSAPLLLQAVIFSPIQTASPGREVVQRGAQRGGLGGVHVRVAALLACPGVHLGEVGLFDGAPRLRRRRQPRGGQVNAGHGAGVGAGEPGGDACPQVTAVRDVAPIPQALAHEPMPQPGDRTRGQAPRRNWAGEAEFGQRRRHHRERVTRIAAVRGRGR